MAEQLLGNSIQSNKSLAVSEVIRLPVNKDIFYGYNIGEPTKGLLVVNSRMMISGWVVGKTPVKAVEVCCRDQVVQEIPTSYPRPDVAKIYGDLAGQQEVDFGFREEILLNQISTQNELIIRAVFTDGNRVPIIIIKLAEVNQSDLLNSGFQPDFLVIGAMKAATSAIYSYLVKHPRVINRSPKEIHFFSYNYEKGLDWYLSHFAAKQDVPSDKKFLMGDASPSYLIVKEVPARVKENFPDVKLIVSLRNPTERAISQYHHHVNRVGDETRSIEEAFSEQEINKAKTVPLEIKNSSHEMNSYINQHGNTLFYLWLGEYMEQINNWLQFFPREQMLILNYHDLEKQPDDLIERLFMFLELDDYIPKEIEKIYENKYSSAPISVVKRLNEYYNICNEELKTNLNIRFN